MIFTAPNWGDVGGGGGGGAGGGEAGGGEDHLLEG